MDGFLALRHDGRGRGCVSFLPTGCDERLAKSWWVGEVFFVGRRDLRGEGGET